MQKILSAGLAALPALALPAQAQAHEADAANIPLLADQICDAMIAYDMTGIGPVTEAFEMMVLDHLGIDKASTPTYRLDIREFWNAHHQEMVCVSASPGYPAPQHILKRVVDMRGTEDFYFDYLLQDRELNLNAVEQTERGPETLVDFLDRILSDPDAESLYDMSEVRRLRAFIVEQMDAKRAAELVER